MIGQIIQARTGSSRYPRKIYEDICGKTTLFRVLEGCKSSIVPHKIILAMPQYDKDEFMARHQNGEFAGAVDDRFAIYFGSADDLVDRYFQAARTHGIDLVVRITADNPLIQGKIIDEMLLEYLKCGYNGFMGNNGLVSSNPFPYGTDVEMFPYWMLAETHTLSTSPYDREHCTPYMYSKNKPYSVYEFKNQRPNTIISTRFKDFSFDTPEDLALIKKIVESYDKHGDLNKAIEEVGDV